MSQLDQAIADFSRAIDLEPDGAQPFGYRGLAFERKGELYQALQDYDNCLRLDATNTEVQQARQQLLAHPAGYRRRLL